MVEDFLIVIDQRRDELVLALRGEIDFATTDELSMVLDVAVKSSVPVVVDLTDVSFIDSSGLKAIAMAAQGRGARSLVRVRGAGEFARQLFATTGLDTVITLEPPGSPFGDDHS
jgi:anti-sigma B factor antagonist